MYTHNILKILNSYVYAVHSVDYYVNQEAKMMFSSNEGSYHCLCYINKGSGKVSVNEDTFSFSAGSLFLFVPGVQIKGLMAAGVEFYLVRFRYAIAYYENEWVFDGTPSKFPIEGELTIKNTAHILTVFKNLKRAAERQGKIGSIKLKALLNELIFLVIEDIRSQLMEGSVQKGIEQSIDFMEEHYCAPITLEQLSQTAGLSSSYYSKCFKDYTGQPPIDYLREIRLKKAKELLMFSKEKLKVVAGLVGYQDEFYFSRVFKKQFGVSPKEFAKQFRSNQDIENR
ncbi:AraC family transcriptional regulator [Rossellomorea vietnamensis]|uniref:AraC family transcriptional regulator n=2 Tax=Rossellomorea TaxID=2837508 RepID=A0A5D4KAL7_9BACI|nr:MULTISPECIES: AraC family transcriptional regulator [Rossellomorea]TYR74338.1 AraC family transcriptional regulator [Rossellomorea vietnamensis]TYS77051.1 AraC family transcriptional regulator [Rossellomorea aquimaris]